MPHLRRGAGSAVVLDGRIHLVGGAVSTGAERTSIACHEAYDPKADRWSIFAQLPGARDHLGVAVNGSQLYACVGRFNTPVLNTGLHHVYLPDQDRWENAGPMPTGRLGHGLVAYSGSLFAMGTEGILCVESKTSPRVYGQMESYDLATDTWQDHAPMTTPRHGSGLALFQDEIVVAGGAPVAGGSIQAATNEGFTLSGQADRLADRPSWYVMARRAEPPGVELCGGGGRSGEMTNPPLLGRQMRNFDFCLRYPQLTFFRVQ